MSKKVLIVKSSPRPGSNSSALADRVHAGAVEAGAQADIFSLHELDIRPCDVCEDCRDTGGVCVIKDDMQMLYPKIEQADAVVFATPIYWFTVSAQLKLFIDRWYAFEFDEGNPTHGKQVGIVLTYGDTNLHNSGAIHAVHTFESMFRYLNGNILGIVHGTANDIGDVEKQPNLLEQAYQLGIKVGTK